MRIRQIVLIAAATIAPGTASAQSAAPQTDSRWLAWLGCWSADAQHDSAGRAIAPVSATCVVPIAGSSAVEALTIARGKIVTRDRLDARVPAHPISGQGCQGSETVDWSSNGRRVYLRADYTCSGNAKGSSTTLYAFSTSGEWLRVEGIRSGGGSVVNVERRHPVALLPVVSADAAHAIDGQQMAVRLARAAAAAPISTDELVEGVHRVDALVVRSWVALSGQQFDVDGQELAALTRADVPQSVLQAVMASSARAQSATTDTHNVDEYLNRPGNYYVGPTTTTVAGGGVAPSSVPPPGYGSNTTVYVCPPAGCYQQMTTAVEPGPVLSTYNGYPTYSYYPYVPYPAAYLGSFYNFRGRTGGPNHRVQQQQQQQPKPLPGPVGRRP